MKIILKKAKKPIAMLLTAVLLAGLLLAGTGCNSERKAERLMNKYGLNVTEGRVTADKAASELTIALIADTHVSLWDQRDAEVADKAESRYEGFLSSDKQHADETFRQLIQYVRAVKPDLCIFAGDVVDSAMYASLEFVSGQMELLEKDGIKVLYSLGNHDFELGSEYFSAKAYEEYLPRLMEISDTNKDGWQEWDTGDYLIFLADDRSNQISPEAADRLDALSRGDKPVIAVSHVPVEPLMDSVLWQQTIDVWRAGDNGNSRVLLGKSSCWPNESTQKYIDAVTREDTAVICVLSGHIHFQHTDELVPDGTVQFCTGAGYNKEMMLIRIGGKQ